MKLRIAKKVLGLYMRAALRSNAEHALALIGSRRGYRARRRWQKWKRNLQRQCDHQGWRGVAQDGRCCRRCGYIMFDPGD